VLLDNKREEIEYCHMIFMPLVRVISCSLQNSVFQSLVDFGSLAHGSTFL